MDLVVYYSRTKNTKEVSEIIAEEKNAKLLEIKDKKSRSGPIGYVLGALDSLRGTNTNISYEKTDLSKYDTVYIGTPVWASKPTPAIIAFIDENDFNGVDIVTFATFMGSGGESTVNIMNEHVRENGGNVKNSFGLRMTGTNKRELVLEALKDE